MNRELVEEWKKAPCLFTFKNRKELEGLRKPQTSAQLFAMDPGPHNGGRVQAAKERHSQKNHR